MASCKDCLSCKVCYRTQVESIPECTEVRDCPHFKDRNRFVELPCKVGDKLFIIDDDGYGEYECSEFSIGVLQELRIFAKCGISGYQNIQECSEYYCGQPCCSTSFVSQDFGKTVFLTKEEAKQALKER
ncbi:MAG: hypothetical protein ACI4HO_02235 [Ruminococcus sp.]